MTTATTVQPGRDHLVHPAAQPFYHEGRAGGFGALLLHGLTASPTEVRPIADHLLARDENMTVSCPLLPGHGTTPRDLVRTGPGDWRRAAVAEIKRLEERCGTISVIGVSLGAVLAADCALRDARIASVVLLAPVFDIYARGAWLMPIARFAVPYVKKNPRSLEKHRANGLFSYDRYPMKSLVQLRRFGRQVRARLPELRVPVLLAAGRHDRYVPWHEFEAIRRVIGSSHVEFVECPDSAHVLPHEPDAPQLLAAIERFLFTSPG